MGKAFSGTRLYNHGKAGVEAGERTVGTPNQGAKDTPTWKHQKKEESRLN